METSKHPIVRLEAGLAGAQEPGQIAALCGELNRRYVESTAKRPVLAPVVTSAERHLSPRYESTRVLLDDFGRGELDTHNLFESLAARLGRGLAAGEREEIEAGLARLVEKGAKAVRLQAQNQTQTEFARKVLSSVNEVVVPAVLRAEGLGFDYNTLRRLWKMGEEFQFGWATSAHPRFDGWLAFDTARFVFDPDGQRLKGLRFDAGVAALREGFLDRVCVVYQKMQDWGCDSYVRTWELRAAFCYEHRCAPVAFDALFGEAYGGSDLYTVDQEFDPQKPPHEQALVLGSVRSA